MLAPSRNRPNVSFAFGEVLRGQCLSAVEQAQQKDYGLGGLGRFIGGGRGEAAEPGRGDVHWE